MKHINNLKHELSKIIQRQFYYRRKFLELDIKRLEILRQIKDIEENKIRK